MSECHPGRKALTEHMPALKLCLAQVEQWCLSEIHTLHGIRQEGTGLTRSKRPSTLFITEFFRLSEVRVEIDFVLRETDPAYDEKSDSCLWTYSRVVRGLHIDANQKWSSGDYLFSRLWAALPNGLLDMTRIGRVHANVIYTGTHLSAFMSKPDETIYPATCGHLWQDRHRKNHAQWRSIDSTEQGIDQSPVGTSKACQSNDFDEREIEHFERINIELVSSDFAARNIARHTNANLFARVKDPFDALEDYEMEVVLEHRLHPMDWVALQRKDHVLICQVSRIDKGESDNLAEQIASATHDWAEGPYRAKFPFRHSYLFHDLYDHHYIDIKDVLRIDQVCTKLEVRMQKSFEVS